MSSERDLLASASCAENQAIYREMVELEITSTFSFQGNRWLADVAPQLLSQANVQRLVEAKERAAAREAAEAELPPHLLFVKGWPTGVPTIQEARLIADVRRRVAAAVGLQINYTDGESVRARYGELVAQVEAKASANGLQLSDQS